MHIHTVAQRMIPSFIFEGREGFGGSLAKEEAELLVVHSALVLIVGHLPNHTESIGRKK